MPLPSKRDHGELRRRLERWLTTQFPEGARPQLSELRIPEGTGMSSETLMFDARWREDGQKRSGSYVARTSPDMSDFPVFPQYDLELQCRCMRMVAAHSDVPVPETPWLELDPEPLGAPFLVMSRVEGIAPSDNPPYVFGGWITEATPEQRQRLQRAAVGVLVRLHAIDLEAAGADFLDRPQYATGWLDQHLVYQRSYYEWAREDRHFDTLERGFDWLEVNRPDDPRPPVLNWGDSRIGNMMFRDFEPVAVLDWEMAALGAPEVDLAWMTYMHEMFARMARGMGLPGVPDFMRRADLVAQYEEFAGRAMRDLEYWEVFAALRYGIISIPIMRRGIAYGQIEDTGNPRDLIMNADLIEALLDGSYWD